MGLFSGNKKKDQEFIKNHFDDCLLAFHETPTINVKSINKKGVKSFSSWFPFRPWFGVWKSEGFKQSSSSYLMNLVSKGGKPTTTFASLLLPTDKWSIRILEVTTGVNRFGKRTDLPNTGHVRVKEEFKSIKEFLDKFKNYSINDLYNYDKLDEISKAIDKSVEVLVKEEVPNYRLIEIDHVNHKEILTKLFKKLGLKDYDLLLNQINLK